ncbi:M16 family metallopeptidase [Aquimarina aquimarini]|uniref:M16 family metallopeptidase n=1 Tax=Aquimarina aquimarini TaxID=1191734 RepID=UPI001F2BAA47|nr:M16 family metallopeptidase [Aquimarina aquimarini]
MKKPKILMKINSTVIILLLFAFCIQVNSQSLNLKKALPVDQSVRKGVLPNGMTYYIKSTDVVKDAASYYIIQNVGSILENDNQQGLAHFLEHMAFNGTKNFKGKGILNTLEKHGAVFSKDINAYTSFDETVYNLDNIPVKDGLVDTCLLILHDWSNYLSLTEEEIDAERGVIKEEWRTGQNGQRRVLEASLPTIFNHSKYAKRIPIGLMDIVENFEYKALRDFYHDWYRTDLQAIAIVGDINVEEIEKKIKARFSSIPAVKNPRERFVVTIPDNKELLYNLGMDPEVSTASIGFGIRHKKPSDANTVGGLKRALLENMAMTMLSSRIREKAQKPEATFLRAGIGYAGSSRTNNMLNVHIAPKPEKQQAAFREVLTEVVRAVKHGYTQSEIDRTIAQFLNSYETRIATKNDQPHGSIINVIQNNYLEQVEMTDIEKEYALAKQIFAMITPQELHQTIQNLYTPTNRMLNVTGVKGKNNLTKTEALQIIKEVENSSDIKPYTETFEGKTLMSGVSIKEGKVEEIKKNKELGSSTFILSNGVKVHYKFTDKEKNSVALQAISYGGKSLIKNSDLPSAELLGDLVLMSGVGEYSATELQKVLAGKTVRFGPGLGEITENLSGLSTTKDVEIMLQLAHLYFVKPRFDKQAYQVLQGSIDDFLLQKSKNIKSQMSDSLTVTLYGADNPRVQIFTKEYANKISFDKIKEIYISRFNNAADFEFYIVGDIKPEVLQPLLAKYVASLPVKNTKEKFKDNDLQWVNKKIDKDIYINMEDPKTNVNISLKIPLEYTIKNRLLTGALSDILQLRLTETLREEEGGVYSPRAIGSMQKEPKSQSSISVSFDCNPDLAEKLITIVHTELNKIATGKINQEDLDKTLTNFLKEREQAKSYNSYDMQSLLSFYRDGYNRNDPKNFENIVTKISQKDIQEFTKEMLKNADTYEVVFKPKQS